MRIAVACAFAVAWCVYVDAMGWPSYVGGIGAIAWGIWLAWAGRRAR